MVLTVAVELPNLTPDQVRRLFDRLLENGDSLLVTADQVLDHGRTRLARSLAILGLEELGKAIGLFERRIEMAYEPEGADFTTPALRQLWSNHTKKLRLVHKFLDQEKYWFGAGDPLPNMRTSESDRYLTTIETWATDHNGYKQTGFYVDVSQAGEPVSPLEPLDPNAVAEVLERVHQIGWQLRLGEHIEAKKQHEQAQEVPPATEADLAIAQIIHRVLDENIRVQLLDLVRQGRPAIPIHNVEYLLTTDTAPLETLGKPGYEAQTRELLSLWDEMNTEDHEDIDP